MSPQLRLLSTLLRHVEKPWLARVAEPAAVRESFERRAWMFRDPIFARTQRDSFGSVDGLWIECARAGTGVMLYLHGGAYIMGSARTHRALVARLCRMTGLAAALPDYRLAPEHAFPAALKDAEASWDALIDRGHAAAEILIAGDSAGGGLALALLARLLARGVRPAGVVAFSPWTDMTLSGDSLRENADADPLLPVGRIEEARAFYLQGADPGDPGASPLFADYPGAPPVFLQAAQTEILWDDTRRMAARLTEQGAEVTLDIWADAPHVLAIFQGWVPEADEALRRAAGFVKRLPGLSRPSDS